MKKLLIKFIKLFDKITTHKNIQRYEHITVIIAITLFVIHLLTIALSPGQKSYLSAIQTPFTVILYFEVVLLILSIAKPLIVSIGKQCEIATLLIIRDIFKYISTLESGISNNEILQMIGVSLIGSLCALTLVGCYYYITKKNELLFQNETSKNFISIKKLISISFIIYFMSLIVNESISGLSGNNQIQYNHYYNVLSLLIFGDVIIFIISLIYSSSYRHVFLESSLIISTILIRISFLFAYPLNIVVIISSLLFCVSTTYLYTFFAKYKLGSEED